METQHKSKRKAIRRGKQGFSCARAFYLNKNRGIENNILREVSMSTNGNEKLIITHVKQGF